MMLSSADLARGVRYLDPAYESLLQRLRRGALFSQAVALSFVGLPAPQLHAAARQTAAALGRPLWRVDLGALADKYIGETEKNLQQLLAHAERAGAVLLFDEADALFGRRSEVEDAHDRYANIEVSYLLARLQAYRGVVVLVFADVAQAARQRDRLRPVVVRFPPKVA